MVLSNLRLCAMLELSVILFQVCRGGCPLPEPALAAHVARWADRGRIGFVVAMIGLGLAGAFCGRHDSEFALFAGGTMTVLLIGMTMGSGQVDATGHGSDVWSRRKRTSRAEHFRKLVNPIPTLCSYNGAARPRFFFARRFDTPGIVRHSFGDGSEYGGLASRRLLLRFTPLHRSLSSWR